jgi:hypothetical protein
MLAFEESPTEVIQAVTDPSGTMPEPGPEPQREAAVSRGEEPTEVIRAAGDTPARCWSPAAGNSGRQPPDPGDICSSVAPARRWMTSWLIPALVMSGIAGWLDRWSGPARMSHTGFSTVAFIATSASGWPPGLSPWLWSPWTPGSFIG